MPSSFPPPFQVRNQCLICCSENALVELTCCGHKFHFRCIPEWPVYNCPVCACCSSSSSVCELRLLDDSCNEEEHQDKSKKNGLLRTGKWIAEEVVYVEKLVDCFLKGTIVCANRTSVRYVLSKVLNCAPMRLSKKFQKKALGKHTFLIPKAKKISQLASNCTAVAMEEHRQRQIILSNAEINFRNAVRLSRKTGGEIEYQNLVRASDRFWRKQFLDFARFIQQPVVGYNFGVNGSRDACRKRRRSGNPASIVRPPYVQHEEQSEKKIKQEGLSYGGKQTLPSLQKTTALSQIDPAIDDVMYDLDYKKMLQVCHSDDEESISELKNEFITLPPIVMDDFSMMKFNKHVRTSPASTAEFNMFDGLDSFYAGQQFPPVLSTGNPFFNHVPRSKSSKVGYA